MIGKKKPSTSSPVRLLTLSQSITGRTDGTTCMRNTGTDLADLPSQRSLQRSDWTINAGGRKAGFVSFNGGRFTDEQTILEATVDQTLYLVLLVIQLLLSLTALICCIYVIVQIFQHGETGRGVVYLLTLFVCGIGGLLTLIYGIQKQKEWNLYKVMTTWGVCILVNVLITVAVTLAPPR